MNKHFIEPFRIHIADKDIQDLHQRLRNTRWPSPIEGSNWADGTDAAYLRDLTNYWLSKYNWREREEKLNAWPHFMATIDGTKIHYIHITGEGQDRVPLLLMHGWPSSFVQLLKMVPFLTGGTPAFDLVIASMPGYPFSDFPAQHGMSFARIAEAIKTLMVDLLGYSRFAARGSDQGALVQQQLGLKYPEHLIGLHRTGITPFMTPLPTDMSEAEADYQQQVAAWAPLETAYARLQSGRPEALTPALADSPVGMASWIIDKFYRWGDCNGDVDATFGRDELLDNLSLHWFTGSGAASIRSYYEALRAMAAAGVVSVPTAIIMPLRDAVTVPAPREWGERFYNVQQWTVMERGGHFSEWEMPEKTADHIREFFKLYL